MRGKRTQLVLGVRRGLPGQRSLQQPLRNDIREAAIGCGCVSAVIECQAKVAFGRLAGAFEDVLAGTQQLYDRERKIGEQRGRRLLSAYQKVTKGARIRSCG